MKLGFTMRKREHCFTEPVNNYSMDYTKLNIYAILYNNNAFFRITN
jgi:hypothetical protein